MNSFDPDTHATFGIFMDNYNACLAETIASGDKPSKAQADKMLEAMFGFAIDIDPSSADAIDKMKIVTQTSLDRMYGQ